MYKRGIIICLVMTMLLGVNPGLAFSNSVPFKDIDGHWGKTEIIKAYNKGLMVGVSEDVFAPDKQISRAQLAVILQRIFKLPLSSGIDVNDSTLQEIFQDVKDGEWYSEAIFTMAANKIFNRNLTHRFHPNEPINRFEVAQAITRCLELKNIKLPLADLVIPADLSDESLSPATKYAAVMMYQSGIIKGYNNQFAGHAFLTRAEAAVIFNRLLAIVDENTNRLDIGLDKAPQEAKEWIDTIRKTKGLHKQTFGEKDVYVYAMGRQNTGGYSVLVNEINLEQDIWVIELKLKVPAPDEIVTMQITYPYEVITVPKNQQTDIRVLDDLDRIINRKINLGTTFQKVIESQKIDLDGDNSPEVVEIIGYYINKWYDSVGNLGASRIIALVIDGQEVWTTVNKGYSGVVLELDDLNNDKRLDIKIMLWSSGSGALKEQYVLLNEKSGIKEVFAPRFYAPQDGFDFDVEDNALIFRDNNTNFAVKIKGRDDLLEYYSTAEAWVDPYSGYFFEDVDNDKLIEIIATQRVCGSCHADIVGNLATTYKFNGERYVPYKQTFYQYNEE